MSYRPTDDPGWHHEHRPSGKIRKCASKGCQATWPVTCHNHTRRHCDPCRAGKARRQARERMRAGRLNKQLRAEDQLDQFGQVLLSARELARKRLSGEMSKDELAAYLRRMSNHDWWCEDTPLWDDDDYPDT